MGPDRRDRKSLQPEQQHARARPHLGGQYPQLFRTTVAWDSYNVNRIDILRGSNSILFGLGSPGGVINATTDSANLRRNTGEVEATTDEFGSFRGTVNLNQAILRNQAGLARRVSEQA